jgi:signal peptide peptidase SppA
MKVTQEKVWAGTEESFASAMQASEGIGVRMAAGGYSDDNGDDEKPRLLEVSDGVATVSIKGPLVNSDSPYLEYFGVTGYPEIREAMLAAASDPEVKQIVLDIDSGGGSVSGVEDTAKLIRLVNDRVKPVTTYADNMASAAYWLGSAAGEVYAGKASLVGSIGVIATFREYSERNKMEGVNVTVIRAGKHKALANPNEKLTPAAEAQIQKLVDASYTVFVEHVAEMRGKSYAYADKSMADGQEFIGQEAVDVGLLDGVTTFDELMSTIKEKSIDSSNNSMDNRGKYSLGLSGEVMNTLSGESEMAKKALTEQDIAALAAGVQLNAGAVAAPVIDAAAAATAAVEQNAEGEGVAAQAAADTKITLVVDAKDALAAVQDASQNVDKVDATVQLLNSQLEAKDASLLQANIKLAKAEEALVAANASMAPLLEIAAKSASNMAIAMGGVAINAEGLSADQVLAEHGRLTAQFQSKFKAGGVAAVTADQSKESVQVPSNALAQARLAAVPRFSK